MNARLERRYRRMLAWYPEGFRAEHEAAMLDCFDQAATSYQRWPSSRESASLVAGALRARGRERVGSSSAGAAWTSGLRVGAFLALGVQMAICVQRWNYDWSYRALFVTTNPQSQIMNLVWISALVAALPLRRRRRAAAAWVMAVLAYVAVLYSFPAQFPSPFFVQGLFLLLPMIAGLLVPAHLILRSRDRLDQHNPWTLPLVLVAPVGIALGVVVADGGATIDAVQVTPYVVLVAVAIAMSRFDPRLAIASTVALLPLALLVLGQGFRYAPAAYSLTPNNVTPILIAVVPLALVTIAAVNRTRAWERLHAPGWGNRASLPPRRRGRARGSNSGPSPGRMTRWKDLESLPLGSRRSGRPGGAGAHLEIPPGNSSGPACESERVASAKSTETSARWSWPASGCSL